MSTRSKGQRPLRLALASMLVAAVFCAGCDNVYPEVVVVNTTREGFLIRNPSFNGCLWNTVLAYGESTSPQRCLPGSDRVHFKKFDASSYNSVLPDGGAEATPRWFNYQTVSDHQVDYGDFESIEIKLEDIEQDFSVPGPYGH